MTSGKRGEPPKEDIFIVEGGDSGFLDSTSNEPAADKHLLLKLSKFGGKGWCEGETLGVKELVVESLPSVSEVTALFFLMLGEACGTEKGLTWLDGIDKLLLNDADVPRLGWVDEVGTTGPAAPIPNNPAAEDLQASIQLLFPTVRNK